MIYGNARLSADGQSVDAQVKHQKTDAVRRRVHAGETPAEIGRSYNESGRTIS